MELACCDGVDVFPHLNKRSILQQQKFAGITCYDANEIDSKKILIGNRGVYKLGDKPKAHPLIPDIT